MWYFILEFWRNNWGEQFSSGNSGYIYTYYYTNLWYECGVSIPEAAMPGKAMIIDKNWQLNLSSTIKETYYANGNNISKVHIIFMLVLACFDVTPSCWYEYNFVHDNIWNGCTGGRKYVRRTRFTSAPIVGVVLCSSTRWFNYSRVSKVLWHYNYNTVKVIPLVSL